MPSVYAPHAHLQGICMVLQEQLIKLSFCLSRFRFSSTSALWLDLIDSSDSLVRPPVHVLACSVINGLPAPTCSHAHNSSTVKLCKCCNCNCNCNCNWNHIYNTDWHLTPLLAPRDLALPLTLSLSFSPSLSLASPSLLVLFGKKFILQLIWFVNE